ncbi:MAG TPA: Clp protease ClpP [Burkholderiaceae bacterium]|nr:Clp protease ClpP [Burkholderiaceae bacterium]
MNNKLLQLYARNRGRGAFRAEAGANGNEATIYLYDVIVDSEAEAEWFGGVAPITFIQALQSAVAAADTVHLRINSPGGSVFGARAMEQAIREARHDARIIAHVDGYAASAASFMMLAAQDIVMAPGAMVMVHKAWALCMGNADDMLALAALLEKLDGTLADSYAKRTKKDAATCLAWMAEETWFTAEEAVAAGLADSVAEDAMVQDRATAWDLSAFAHPPARAAMPAATPFPEPAAPTAAEQPGRNRADYARRQRGIDLIAA